MRAYGSTRIRFPALALLSTTKPKRSITQESGAKEMVASVNRHRDTCTGCTALFLALTLGDHARLLPQ